LSILVAADGVVTINGEMTVDQSGNIETSGTITAAQVIAPSMLVGVTQTEVALHTHGGVLSGNSTTLPLV